MAGRNNAEAINFFPSIFMPEGNCYDFNMELTVGKTTFTVPDELIDCQDFAESLFRVARNSVHIRSDEIQVRKNWSAGDKKRIGKELKSYKAIKKLAKDAGSTATSSLAVAICELYTDTELWLDVEAALHFDVLPTFEVLASASINPPPERDELDELIESGEFDDC